MKTTAGVLWIFLGLGFGVPCAFGLRHLLGTGQVWTFMGFPTYGGGPFEKAGLATGPPLLTAFLVVCVLQVVLGVLILADVGGAKVLSCVVLVVSMIFWVGFALPVGPPVGMVSTVMVLATR